MPRRKRPGIDVWSKSEYFAHAKNKLEQNVLEKKLADLRKETQLIRDKTAGSIQSVKRSLGPLHQTTGYSFYDRPTSVPVNFGRPTRAPDYSKTKRSQSAFPRIGERGSRPSLGNSLKSESAMNRSVSDKSSNEEFDQLNASKNSPALAVVKLWRRRTMQRREAFLKVSNRNTNQMAVVKDKSDVLKIRTPASSQCGRSQKGSLRKGKSKKPSPSPPAKLPEQYGDYVSEYVNKVCDEIPADPFEGESGPFGHVQTTNSPEEEKDVKTEESGKEIKSETADNIKHPTTDKDTETANALEIPTLVLPDGETADQPDEDNTTETHSNVYGPPAQMPSVFETHEIKRSRGVVDRHGISTEELEEMRRSSRAEDSEEGEDIFDVCSLYDDEESTSHDTQGDGHVDCFADQNPSDNDVKSDDVKDELFMDKIKEQDAEVFENNLDTSRNSNPKMTHNDNKEQDIPITEIPSVTIVTDDKIDSSGDIFTKTTDHEREANTGDTENEGLNYTRRNVHYGNENVDGFHPKTITQQYSMYSLNIPKSRNLNNRSSIIGKGPIEKPKALIEKELITQSSLAILRKNVNAAVAEAKLKKANETQEEQKDNKPKKTCQNDPVEKIKRSKRRLYRFARAVESGLSFEHLIDRAKDLRVPLSTRRVRREQESMVKENPPVKRSHMEQGRMKEIQGRIQTFLNSFEDDKTKK